MTIRRYFGFVVGCDPGAHGQTVWKVRVKDPTSQFNGQKFAVASVRDGLTLAQGLNVTFVLGIMDGPTGGRVTRAIDVLPVVADARPAVA